MSPNMPASKTNPSRAQVAPHIAPQPPLQPVELSPLQLAAARAFARGGRTLAIAEALRVNRRTLSRWKRLPAFRDEILRVHRALSQPSPRPAPSQQLQPTEREFLNQVYTSAMKQFMKL